jgi:hypothetical protein
MSLLSRDNFLPPCTQALPPAPANVTLPIISLDEFRRSLMGNFNGLKVQCMATPDITVNENDGSIVNINGTAEVDFTIPRGHIASNFSLSSIAAGAYPDYLKSFSWDDATGTGSTDAVTISQSVFSHPPLPNSTDLVIRNLHYGGMQFYRDGIGQVMMAWSASMSGGAETSALFASGFDLVFYTKVSGVTPEVFYGVPVADGTQEIDTTTGSYETPFPETATGATVLGIPIYMKGWYTTGEQVSTRELNFDGFPATLIDTLHQDYSFAFDISEL